MLPKEMGPQGAMNKEERDGGQLSI